VSRADRVDGLQFELSPGGSHQPGKRALVVLPIRHRWRLQTGSHGTDFCHLRNRRHRRSGREPLRWRRISLCMHRRAADGQHENDSATRAPIDPSQAIHSASHLLTLSSPARAQSRKRVEAHATVRPGRNTPRIYYADSSWQGSMATQSGTRLGHPLRYRCGAPNLLASIRISRILLPLSRRIGVHRWGGSVGRWMLGFFC